MMLTLQSMEIYANKHAQMKLTEFEIEAYEQECRTIASQMKYIRLNVDKDIKDWEKQNPEPDT